MTTRGHINITTRKDGTGFLVAFGNVFLQAVEMPFDLAGCRIETDQCAVCRGE